MKAHSCPPPPSQPALQDYFREVTRQDVANLLSFMINPEEDDALLVPQLGRTSREPLPAFARAHPPAPAGGRGGPLQAGHEEDDGAEVIRGLCVWGGGLDIELAACFIPSWV